MTSPLLGLPGGLQGALLQKITTFMSVSGVRTVCSAWAEPAEWSVSPAGTWSTTKARWSRCTSAVRTTPPVTISLTRWGLPWPTTASLADTDHGKVPLLLWLGTLQTPREKEAVLGKEGRKASGLASSSVLSQPAGTPRQGLSHLLSFY